VRPATLITLILTCALIVLAIIWVAPVVGVKNSACERYPLHLRLPLTGEPASR
jgi:hypothetical protein